LAASLEILWNCGVRFERLNMPLAQTAIGFMAQYDISFYDAIYAALAYTLQVPLLTYDAKGHKKIKEIEVMEL
jgi:predicted nucleic acid-binding protein